MITVQIERKNSPEINHKHNSVQQILDRWITVSLGDILSEILESLILDVPDIQSIVLASNEGLPIASARNDLNQDETILSAMTAAIISVVKQASRELNKKNPNDIMVRFLDGLIFVRRLNKEIMISIIARKEISIDLLDIALNKAQIKLWDILDYQSHHSF